MVTQVASTDRRQPSCVVVEMIDRRNAADAEPLTLCSMPTTLPPVEAPRALAGKRGARLREALRDQLVWGRIDLDALVADHHPVRCILAVTLRLELSALYHPIEARDEVAGAPAIDPAILLALWVYATSEGVGSARELWRLTREHVAYRWLCGGVAVGYHTLSDFRTERGEVFSQLISQVLALLMQQQLVELHRVAQDGTRVRASAGAGSFRREPTLDALMQQARAHLAAIMGEAADPALGARRTAARRRGAQDRIERLDAALAQIPDVTATKQRSGAKDTTIRVSTTDPDARVMKMGDGGFRPAFNIQFATTTDLARVIVGVDASNRGSDMGLSTPMLAQIEQRTGVRPTELLVDGGYTQHHAIDAAAAQQVTVFAPVPKPRHGDTRDPHAARDGDSAAVAAWRARMGTDDAKQIYKQRAATAETVNADAKTHRGLDHLSVRGLGNVLASATLFALTYDLLRLIALHG